MAKRRKAFGAGIELVDALPAGRVLGHDYFDLTEFVDVLLGRLADTLRHTR